MMGLALGLHWLDRVSGSRTALSDLHLGPGELGGSLETATSLRVDGSNAFSASGLADSKAAVVHSHLRLEPCQHMRVVAINSQIALFKLQDEMARARRTFAQRTTGRPFTK